MSEARDTLHDFSIEYVKILAEVFGWRVRTALGHSPGPDIVIEHIFHTDNEEKVDAVMFIESEVGHNQRGAPRYFKELCDRLEPLIKKYRAKYGEKVYFSIVLITNAPRRLTKYLRKHENRRRLENELELTLIEGWNIFVVPVFVAREVLSAIFVRAMGAVVRLA